MRPFGSMQGRLLAWVLGSVAVVWLAAAAVTWVDVRGELDELLDGHLAQAAALLVAQQARELDDDEDDGRHGDARHVDAPSLHRYAAKVAFQVWHEGRLVLHSDNAPTAPMGADAVGRRFTPGLRTVEIGGTGWRVFAAHGAERDVRVYVGEQLGSRASILRAVTRGTLWPLGVALPLLALGAAWAVRRGVAPLRRLGAALAARAPGALQPVDEPDAPTEMAPMVDALNALFARIDALIESERRFTADAAHELRTPIAAIRTQAQVALGATDDAARRHALQRTLAGCDRAARLVGQLLTLARLEAQDAPPDARVDVGTLARGVVAELAAQALDKGQSIELDAAEGCVVRGDDALVGVLLRNLVDNAIRYAPEGGVVRVAVKRRGAEGGVTLTVDDSGPGLADAQIARLGERFWRELGSGQSGSGLGWSIVRRIAALHRAEVRVARSSALGGLAVAVDWPAA